MKLNFDSIVSRQCVRQSERGMSECTRINDYCDTPIASTVYGLDQVAFVVRLKMFEFVTLTQRLSSSHLYALFESGGTVNGSFAIA
jgi:hypothetical protein